MKSLILPSIILFVMIAFIGIVDGTDFKRSNAVQTAQGGIHVNRSNLLADSAELKHASEVKTDAGIKVDVQTQSVAMSQHTQTITVDNVSPITNAISKGNSANKQQLVVSQSNSPSDKLKKESAIESRPDAIPVVTMEEAEKLNAFTEYLMSRKATVVEGEITERSKLPDPGKSDYPNCRFTAHFIGNSIKSGEPCPKEMAFIIEGFENYKTLQTDNLKTGDKVQCRIIPFEQLPEDFQSIQQTDDLNLFLLENYYVIDILNINSYSDDSSVPKSGILFSDGNDKYISVFERHINPPIPQTRIDAQNKCIHNDLQKMNKLLDGYDDEKIKEINELFSIAWKEEKDKDLNDYNRWGNYVWRNVDDSFWCLPTKYTLLSPPDLLTQESLDSFSALKKACEANGVQLIVSLVPDLHAIAARVINAEFRDIPDLQTASFVKQLSEIGIETIYASDAIIQNYHRYPFAFFFPPNGHPSDTTQDVITDILSERMARYDLNPVLDTTLFSVRQSPHVYANEEGYFFPENCDIGDNKAGKAYTNREILYNGKSVPRSKDSQMIVIGNSYQATPMDYPDTIPTLLSYKLNTIVDWYRISGYGPFSDIIVQFLTRADFFLKKKKVLVFYVGTNHLLYVNKNRAFSNIALLDNARIILSNKQMIARFVPTSNTEDDSFLNTSIWGNLSNADKSCFSIEKSGESVFSLRLDPNNEITIDESKPLTCIIPTACLPEASCSLRINNQSQTIPSFSSRHESKFIFLSFDLPPGTKEITIQAEGNPGAMFVIKDIQIWQ